MTPHLDTEAFDGSVSVSWYLVTVKQDLEARGLIEKSRPRGTAGPPLVRRFVMMKPRHLLAVPCCILIAQS